MKITVKADQADVLVAVGAPNKHLYVRAGQTASFHVHQEHINIREVAKVRTIDEMNADAQDNSQAQMPPDTSGAGLAPSKE